MSVAKIYSRAQDGINAPLVTVEVHLSRGLPSFSIVGLPETTVKESKERVRSAILNNQFEFPLSRITINLAPADLPKEGGRFDLPIALGILIASGQIPEAEIKNHEVIGELSLTGQLRAISGVLPVSMAMYNSQRNLILPKLNADEAALVEGTVCKPASHLLEVCAHLAGENIINTYKTKKQIGLIEYKTDLNDIYNHEHAKRALEIAAAGGHNLLKLLPINNYVLKSIRCSHKRLFRLIMSIYLNPLNKSNTAATVPSSILKWRAKKDSNLRPPSS